MFTVKNTGNVILKNVSVKDPKVPVLGNSISELKPGTSDSTSFTAVYVLTQSDLDAGKVENNASVSGTDPSGERIFAQSHAEGGVEGGATVVTLASKPMVELELTGKLPVGNGPPQAGQAITYAFRVINTGNVTLRNLSIASLNLSAVDIVTPAGQLSPRVAVPVLGSSIAKLAPGEDNIGTFSASYTLTLADIEGGRIDATALVTASAPSGDTISDVSNDPSSLGAIDVENDGELDNPTVLLLPQRLSLTLEKSGAYQESSGHLALAGDKILYRFLVTNNGNVSARDVKPSDPGPRFNGLPGTGELSDPSPAFANLKPGESHVFTATYTLTEDDVANGRNLENGVVNTAVAVGTGLKGRTARSAEAQAALSLPGFLLAKTTPLAEVQRGDRVPYSIRVQSLRFANPPLLNVIDQIPAGFAYVTGSATLDGRKASPEVEGRRLLFRNVQLPGEGTVEIGLTLVVTASSRPGEYVNRAWLETGDGAVLSAVATAVVEVATEAMFDCGDILGKVFDDKNRNGYQDEGELGLPGVRIATVRGLLLTSDVHGRFHVACADLPDERIGTNYTLKLDPRSLPSGYRLTTENPRVVRLTAGKVSEFSFGASVGRVVRLDLMEEAFERGTVELRPEWRAELGPLIQILDQEPSILRLVYYGADSGNRLVSRRLKAVRKTISDEWHSIGGRYRLDIEMRAESGERSKMAPAGR